MAEDPTLLRSLFIRMIEVSPEERSRALDELCGTDASLRSRLERLLAAEEAAGDFVDVPAAALLREMSSAADPEQIGPYRIVMRLGEGGFGVVYLAKQTAPMRRRVALKLIKSGMDSAQVVARFEAERQALALMDHPNIARVFDAGTADPAIGSRPYFAMEYVGGEPITQHCDRFGLSVPERLGLFVQVCRAIQHAHTKGIIHRDIKPSNVLVSSTQDGGPTVKVIDFGIAKALGRELGDGATMTAMGQMIGTPEYMSPEQAEAGPLDIDTRSDVYSLGVLLYELLSGARPFELKRIAVGEMARVIREQDPPRPSTRVSSLGAQADAVATKRRTSPQALARELARELEWIPLKALRKSPVDRYQSAGELAEDVESYLAGGPLKAAPESAAYMVRKFVRRNRGLVVAGGAVIAGLVVGVLGLSIGLGRAAAEADRAERQAIRAEQLAAEARESAAHAVERTAEAETARAEAESARAEAEEQFDQLRLLTRFVAFELHDKVEQLSGSLELRREITDQGIAYLDLLSSARPDDQALQRDLVLGYVKAGNALGMPGAPNLGDFLGAEAQYRRALEVAERLCARYPEDPLNHAELSRARARLATILVQSGQLHEALALAEAVVIHGRERVGRSPGDLEAQFRMAMALDTMADVLEALNRLDECMELYLETIETYRGLVSIPDGSPLWRRNLGITLNRAGYLHERMGRWDDAQRLYEEALALMDARLAAAPEDDSAMTGVANASQALGDFHRDRAGQLGLAAAVDAARPYYDRAMDLYGRVLDADPNNMTAAQAVARQAGRLGEIEQMSGNLDAALHHFAVAADLLGRATDRSPNNARAVMDLATAIRKCATIRWLQGDVAATRQNTEETISLYEQALRLDPHLVLARRGLALSQVFFAQIIAQQAALDPQGVTNSDIVAAMTLAGSAAESLEMLRANGQLSPGFVPHIDQARDLIGALSRHSGEGVVPSIDEPR